MPRGDGTGPTGAGPMTGKGLGYCAIPDTAEYGTGPGMGLGFVCRRGLDVVLDVV